LLRRCEEGRKDFVVEKEEPRRACKKAEVFWFFFSKNNIVFLLPDGLPTRSWWAQAHPMSGIISAVLGINRRGGATRI
jgi:hypothetical protein